MPSSNIKRVRKKPLSTNAPEGSANNFTETAMDDFLARLNLYRKPIAKDGSCLFRAVSEQVYHCQAKHLQVRKDCIDFMRQNREKFEAFLEGPFDHHLFRLQNPKEWAGQVEISALSLMYKKDFIVYQEINADPTKVTDNSFKDKILLCYSNGNHYDAVYNLQFQKDAALCQSLVYEILYQKVFSELDRRDNLARSPRGNPPPDLNNMSYYQNGLMEDESLKDDTEDNSGWTEVRSRSSKAKSARQHRGHEQEDLKDEAFKPSLDQKHGWQAKRSLDGELYRNIELEVWEESKNGQEQQDWNYAASIQYQPGDKCFAFIGHPDGGDKVYEAIVVYLLPVQGNIEVRIPGLSNKSFVIPFDNLKPSEHQQELNYKELSGYYKKSDGAGGQPSGDGLRDDGKRGGRRRNNLPGRPPRGGKGDEQMDDASTRKGFQDESYGRPRSGPGLPHKFGRGRGRGRYPRGRDDRQVHKDEEEAKLIAAEQAKLAELQGKDPAAFPALPTQQVDEKPLPSAKPSQDQTSAEFWSRLINSPGTPGPVTPKEQFPASAATDNKQPPVPSTTINHQSTTAKVDEKELETRREKLPTREHKEPVSKNVEGLNNESGVAKKCELDTVETSNSTVTSEKKIEPNEVRKSAFPSEKNPVKDSKDLSKEATLNVTKQPGTAFANELNASNVEQVKLVDSPVRRTAWSKETPERGEPKPRENEVKELEANDKKTAEPPSSMKQGVRGVIRMSNLSNNRTLQATEASAAEPGDTNKDDARLSKKPDDSPSLKPALVGAESPPSSNPEKKTVTFAEPLNESAEVKLLFNTGKDVVAGNDGKKDILAPSTLVSVEVKPAPTSEVSQENPSVSILASNQDASEDETTIAKNPIPSNNTTTTTTTTTGHDTEPDSLEESNQSLEAPQAGPSSSPTVSQHQVSYQALPYLQVMYFQSPNMTGQPRMPAGMSLESDGSDLPDDPNTLRYFFNLGLQHHMFMSQHWASQQMMYYPPVFPMPSADHLPPHPAVSMGQQLSPAVPQMMYQPQQMQAYHPAQGAPVVQENTSFSDRNSMDRNSPGQTQAQQQQQHHQGMSVHQPQHYLNQQQQAWRPPRSSTGYQNKQHVGGYNSQVQNQPTPRGAMQQGAGGNNVRFRSKKYQKHRGDQHYNAQSQHAQIQGSLIHGAHAYSNASQTAGSHMPGSDHTVGKGAVDYYYGNQQLANFHGGLSSNMSAGGGAPHSAGASLRAQYK